MEHATRTAPERLPDGALRFTVRFSPPGALLADGGSNNLGLTAAGTVTVSPEEVVFADSRSGDRGDPRLEQRRRFRRADIANVGYGETEQLIVVRTIADDRFVALWMQTREDAQALLELLPKTTTPEFIEQQESMRRFRERIHTLAPRAPVTPTIVALNVAVFIVMLMAGAGLAASNPEVHVRFGSNYGPLTWSGEYWRLLASAFIHFGLFHIVLNMYALYNGGDLTERLYGSARFAVIYLLSALAGSVASGWWNPYANSAGASGAVFGVYGALLMFFAVRRKDIPLQLYRSAGKGALLLCIYSLGLGLASSLFDSPVRIDNAGHIGGLLGGVLSGLLLVRPFEPAARTRPQPLRVAAVALGVCALLAMVAAPMVSGRAARGAGPEVNRLVHDLKIAEVRALGRFREISQELAEGKLAPEAAADAIREQVLRPWQLATTELRNHPSIEPADSLTARRLAAAQNLGAAYERAFALTANSLATGSDRADPELQRAWEQLNRQARLLREVEEPAPD